MLRTSHMNVLSIPSKSRAHLPGGHTVIGRWAPVSAGAATFSPAPLGGIRFVEPVPGLVICEGGASPLDTSWTSRPAQDRHCFTFLLCVTGRLVLRCGIVGVALEAGQATVFSDAISIGLQIDDGAQIVALRFEGDAAKVFQPMIDASRLRAVAIDLAAAALFLNYCNILATS